MILRIYRSRKSLKKEEVEANRKVSHGGPTEECYEQNG